MLAELRPEGLLLHLNITAYFGIQKLKFLGKSVLIKNFIKSYLDT